MTAQIPAGWRRLAVGDVIEAGDLVWLAGRWMRSVRPSRRVGSDGLRREYIRKVQGSNTDAGGVAGKEQGT